MAEELEPLWLAALLLSVPEAFGRYISLHSARSACGLIVLGRANLREGATRERERAGKREDFFGQSTSD